MHVAVAMGPEMLAVEVRKRVVEFVAEMVAGQAAQATATGMWIGTRGLRHDPTRSKPNGD